MTKKKVAHKTNESKGKVEDTIEDSKKTVMEGKVPFWNLLDLDNSTNFTILILWRLFEACTLTWNVQHPD